VNSVCQKKPLNNHQQQAALFFFPSVCFTGLVIDTMLKNGKNVDKSFKKNFQPECYLDSQHVIGKIHCLNLIGNKTKYIDSFKKYSKFPKGYCTITANNVISKMHSLRLIGNKTKYIECNNIYISSL
jgi:hypothetical protein